MEILEVYRGEYRKRVLFIPREQLSYTDVEAMKSMYRRYRPSELVYGSTSYLLENETDLRQVFFSLRGRKPV